MIPTSLDRNETVTDVVEQLTFIEDELKVNNLAYKMQQLFPEGQVFVTALYGLAWCELVVGESAPNSDLKERALNEALYAYDYINQTSTTKTFQENLNPRFGIFYTGWKNYLLSKILLAHPNFKGRKLYEKSYKTQCLEITEALSMSTLPFLESYKNNSWPADMCVAMASISNHDKIFKPSFSSEIRQWIANLKSNLDTKTGLLPYKVNAKSGLGIQPPRGSGTTLYLRMLKEVDPIFGKSQYDLFKKNFVSTALTLPCVWEYPVGTSGLGDIDSGPVILGVGFSATIVSIGTLGAYGDTKLCEDLYKTVNAFGFPISISNRKLYLFGLLPMADAFIAWSRASNLNFASGDNNDVTTTTKWQFHIISVVILISIWAFFYRKVLFRKLRKNQIQ